MRTAIRPNKVGMVLGMGALVLLALGLTVRPQTVLQGWLIGFVFVSGIPLGSLALLLVHRLTGGRWGAAVAPTCLTAASTIPLLIVLFLPVLLFPSILYPWAAEPSLLRPQVAHLYLNHPAFILRSAVALVGFSVLALLVVRGRLSTLVAALGLVFYGLAMSLIAVDWILSLDSGFSSSAFAAALMIEQLLSALSFAALAGGAYPERGAKEDLGGLILATLLGAVYLDFMSYVVIWYGNLPEKAAWYLTRGQGGWQWVLIANVVLGVFAPFCLLLVGRCRQNNAVLRVVGGLILFGFYLHVLWLTAPAFEPGAIVSSVLAVITLSSLAASSAQWMSAQWGHAYAE